MASSPDWWLSYPQRPLENHLFQRWLGLVPYTTCFEQMKRFNAQATSETADEIWCVQHPAVYTLGLAAQKSHLPDLHSPGQNIAVVETDRGGQVTYHGPGQLILYPLLNLKRRRLHVRPLVQMLQQSIRLYLKNTWDLDSQIRPSAPGVYLNEAKIAAIGLKIRAGRCYHGVSFNVRMDLTPFSWINPCGYIDLPVTDLYAQHVSVSLEAACQGILTELIAMLPPL